MKYDQIIVRYGELGIKSPPIRRKFEQRLASNIKNAFPTEIEIEQGRVFIKPENWQEAIQKLKNIFGIVSYSPVIQTKTTHEDVTQTLETYIDHLITENKITPETRFAIRCRRVGKHEFTSQEFAAFAGSVVVRKLGCPVDLTNPELKIYIEIRQDDTYIFHEKIQGPGGLPLGTQGKVISLLSSGIDSPVATYLMMKRGCTVTALYFDGENYASTKALEKVKNLVKTLKTYSYGSKLNLIVVPYEKYLKQCQESAPERLTCVLCKAGMYKTAEEIAQKEDALAVIDGSSVGQVASQTLPNILATRESIDIPILSPLIGLDKLEIEKIAKEIGTFQISQEDDGGCKAVPKHPETKADINKVQKAKKDIQFTEIIKETANNAEIIKKL